MNQSSQWFVAEAVASITRGIGSQLAFETACRGGRWVASRDWRDDLPAQGFTVVVRSGPCLAVENAVGCTARILAGQAWITAEGDPGDVIADVGMTVRLKPGGRFNFSALYDHTTVVVTAHEQIQDVRFCLQTRDGLRVLTVTAGNTPAAAFLSAAVSSVAGWVRRRLTPTSTAANGLASS